MSLKNARVLVIGGTSGIGLGVASAAAERGAIPIVVSRQQSSVDRALSQLPEHARGATVDLTDLSAVERLAADNETWYRMRHHVSGTRIPSLL